MDIGPFFAGDFIFLALHINERKTMEIGAILKFWYLASTFFWMISYYLSSGTHLGRILLFFVILTFCSVSNFGRICIWVVFGRLFLLSSAFLGTSPSFVQAFYFCFGHYLCTNHHCLYRFYITWVYRLLFLRKFHTRTELHLALHSTAYCQSQSFFVSRFLSLLLTFLHRRCLAFVKLVCWPR